MPLTAASCPHSVLCGWKLKPPTSMMSLCSTNIQELGYMQVSQPKITSVQWLSNYYMPWLGRFLSPMHSCQAPELITQVKAWSIDISCIGGFHNHYDDSWCNSDHTQKKRDGSLAYMCLAEKEVNRAKLLSVDLWLNAHIRNKLFLAFLKFLLGWKSRPEMRKGWVGWVCVEEMGLWKSMCKILPSHLWI